MRTMHCKTSATYVHPAFHKCWGLALHCCPRASCGSQAGICTLGLLLHGCYQRACTSRGFGLLTSSYIHRSSSCLTLWHIPIIHGVTMQYATVSSKHTVLYAVAALACHTKQTPLQMHLGNFHDKSPQPALKDLLRHSQSSCNLRVLAVRQLQPKSTHPCRVCIWKYGSQCQRDPHFFCNTGHGGSHSRVGIHARPAKAL